MRRFQRREFGRNSVNSSVSKQQYSFPKASRFPKPYSSGAARFYDQPAPRCPAVVFGKTQRLQSQKIVGPGPCKYSVNDKLIYPKASRFAMGLGRQEMMKTGYLQQIFNKLPGPGKYNVSIKAASKFPCYTQKRGVWQVMLKGKSSQAEDLKAISTGFEMLSKFKKKGSGAWSKGMRFQKESNRSPGPGKYSPATAINASGRYCSSRLRSGRKYSFSSDARRGSLRQESTPGPGRYKCYSDFGQLVDSLRKQQQRPI